MKLNSIIISALCGLSFNAKSQIRGKLKSDSSVPVAYANIKLLDSVGILKDYAISDDSGNFVIKTESKEGYLLSISAVGFELLEHKLNSREDNPFIELVLTPAKYTLEEVTVTSSKPLIESRLGKLIYNVENGPILQTSSGIDLLSKAPGVITDLQNQSISLNGKKVLVLIDGRRTYLDGAQLFQYLNNIQGGTIEKIEIINNPSAKYDANAIINIITKKDKTHGWNALITNHTGYRRQPDTKTSVAFNYRTKYIALSTTMGGNFDKSPSQGSLFQKTIDNTLDQKFNALTQNKGIFGKLSLDYFLDKKQTLGLAYARNQYDNKTFSESISDQENSVKGLRTLMDHNTSDKEFYRDLYSINYTAKFSSDNKLAFNADYTKSNTLGDNQYVTTFKDSIYRRTLNNLSLDNKIFSSSIDYEALCFEKYNFEGGVRISNIQTDNFNTFNTQNGFGSNFPEYQNDTFHYDENVYAGYVTISRDVGENIEMQLGLRGEYTHTAGRSETLEATNKSKYFNLFPTFSIDYAINPNHKFTISFDKSIERPSFRMLNPFRYYNDIYNASEGNPFLKPAYSYEGVLQYLLGKKYVFTLSYEHINGEAQQYFLQDKENNITISKYENYGQTKMFVVGGHIPVSITKWWDARFQTQLLYLSLKKEDFSKGGPGVTLNTNSTFKLPKKYFLELSSTFQYASAYGIYKLDPIYAFNLSASKSFFNEKLSVKINASDLGSLYRWHSSTTQNNIFYDGRSRGRGTMYTIVLSYKLGKTTIRGANAKSKSLGADQGRSN